LEAVIGQVMRLATQLKVTKGRKLRVDSTVVETDIHHPVDSTLLGDGVRVLRRWLDKARRVVHGPVGLGKDALHQQASAARERVLQIMQAARQRGEAAADRMRTAYQELVDLSQQVVDHAQAVSDHLHQQTTQSAQALARQLDTFVPRVQQVIRQTTHRVLDNQPVPANQKIVSLFEPHTAIIRKGKAGKPVEFGRVVWLDEVDGGLISRVQVLSGNPPDADQLVPSLQHHQALFDRPPSLLAGDRKVFSPKGEAFARDQGVTYVVLPKPGAKSQARQIHENQPWFRSGRNWRSGLEGRISVLKRRYGLRRCRYHGDQGMQRWVAWGVIAYDFATIARQITR
jgi:IS5 family transposase